MRTSRLPANVAALPDAIRYSATDNADVQRLALALRSITGLEATLVATGLISQRVMFPPAYLLFPVWLAKRRGMPEDIFWGRVFNHGARGRKMALDVLEDAARWAVRGKDREHPNSAGGFSQREVNFIAGSIATVKRVVAERAA